MAVSDALSSENYVFRVWITWNTFLIIKMLLMSFLTVFWRMRKRAFENAEDLPAKGTGEIKKDEDVERVRRCHLNDLENIPAFIFASFM
jgi:glutathione S-transferase